MKESISRGRFIRLGTTLGVGAAASSTLAARGGGGSGGDSGGENEGSTAIPEGLSGEEVAEGEPIAREEAVEPNSDVAFTNAGSGQPAVVILLENRDLVAYSAVCAKRTQCFTRETRATWCVPATGRSSTRPTAQPTAPRPGRCPRSR